MKRSWTLLTFAALALSPGARAQDLERGKAYFEGFGCIRCHTIDGKGGHYGPDLTFVGYRKSPQWLDMWLKNPHGWKNTTPMPDFHLDDENRAVLVDYLSSLKGGEYLASRPWNSPELNSDPVKKGAAIYDMVGCVGCHGRGGVGGFPNNNVAGGKIPALVKVAEGYSKDELMTKIRQGVPHSQKADPNGAEPMIHMPTWGQVLKDDEISAVADYLISLKPKKAGEEW